MADGLSQNYWREDETLARKRLELVIVGARSTSLSRTDPIANVPLRRDIQSSGEIPLLICCRCSDGGSAIQFMVGGSRDPGPLRRQSVVPKRLLIKASGRVSGTMRSSATGRRRGVESRPCSCLVSNASDAKTRQAPETTAGQSAGAARMPGNASLGCHRGWDRSSEKRVSARLSLLLPASAIRFPASRAKVPCRAGREATWQVL